MDKQDGERKRRRRSKLRQDWAGGLRHLREQYTSLELQHKASDWRVDAVLRELARPNARPARRGIGEQGRHEP